MNRQNLNTVLATVSWELLEPQEGQYDFRLVDGLLDGAREHHLKLVFLWFGSWKNGVSSYVPAWVKQDTKRFPRVQTREGRGIEVLSPCSPENCRADARALAVLMRHLRRVDSRQHTVLMIQVENESGTLGQSRDYSPLAEAAFNQPIPAEFGNFLDQHRERLIPEFKKSWEEAGGKCAGNWKEVFGVEAEGNFMSWQMAHYINQVAAAGKAEYPLPMYANAWLVQFPGEKAGQYPSGGPVSKVMDIWHAGAPALDFLSPDIYLSDFRGVCASYNRSGNPLFIPECNSDARAVGKAFYAFGQHDALGFCPFAIDAMPEDRPLKEGYALLRNLLPILTQNPCSKIGLFQQAGETKTNVDLGGYSLEVDYAGNADSPAYGIVVATGADEFLVAGAGLRIHFGARGQGPRSTGIISIDEGRLAEGKWIPGRRLNGDENGGGWRLELPANKPGLEKIKLYRYE